MELPKHWTNGWKTRIKNKKTGKVLTPEELAIEMNKENEHCALVACDIDGIYCDVEEPGFYVLMDECGNAMYIDSTKYEVTPPEICVFCGYDPSKDEKREGKQWAMSFTLHSKYVCGNCGNAIGIEYVK